MHPHDRYPPPEDSGPEHQLELPELPIPRPIEVGRPAAAGPEIEVPAPLGGGASFTAAEEASIRPPAGRESSALGPAGGDPEPVPPSSDVEPGSAADARFTWELAARLTAGMLANPARSQASVKDAMGLFDQFLHEMDAYARISSSFDTVGEDARRRREHGEYFHAHHQQAEPAAPPAATPATPAATRPAQPRPIMGLQSNAPNFYGQGARPGDEERRAG